MWHLLKMKYLPFQISLHHKNCFLIVNSVGNEEQTETKTISTQTFWSIYNTKRLHYDPKLKFGDWISWCNSEQRLDSEDFQMVMNVKGCWWRQFYGMWWCSIFANDVFWVFSFKIEANFISRTKTRFFNSVKRCTQPKQHFKVWITCHTCYYAYMTLLKPHEGANVVVNKPTSRLKNFVTYKIYMVQTYMYIFYCIYIGFGTCLDGFFCNRMIDIFWLHSNYYIIHI